jgi:acyl-CoA synthetase (AMP-forming)/AMP-acid ligase II
MLGYLNAPSPFTEDGWFITGDHVEVDGEYLRILGRNSEIINVGGEKVYPSEVESLIQEIENVAEVTVYGERNAITGNIVCASIRLKSPEDPKRFAENLKEFCRRKLQPFKVPVRVRVVGEKQHSERFKKLRPAR